MIKDMCKFFADIEADPNRQIYGLTVRDMIAAKNHLLECERCYLSSQRVLAKAPKDNIYDLFEEN